MSKAGSTATGPQIPLPLDHRPAQGRDDFLVSQSNAVAVAWVDKWPDWPQPIVVLSGPEGSGKTHLADVWRAGANAASCNAMDLTRENVPELLTGGGLVVEDIELLRDPAALFHLLNFAREKGASLMLTCTTAPGTLHFPLADLMSRLKAAPHVQLLEPDDMLLIQLIAKLFAERGVHASPDMLEYIAHRIDRSAHAARSIVEKIDFHALSHGRRLNMKVIRDVLKASADKA
ncbi:DnaA regulatory inactivator HdaA [Pyruvatibacter sp. HU-CL02332]|uniref:DnaA ATPase domain-containing protein n=1 Tax=Pyruvatibacter sp. HU-CL02332 TaxID=3127650 RepID=UPI00310667AA